MGSSFSFRCYISVHLSSDNLRMRKRNTWHRDKRTILEPASSTSRRGARAAYHDEYPQDFGPRIAYTVSLVSDTSRPPIRQGGREMSTPRPYETYPFRPPVLFTSYTISIYMKKCLVFFFHVAGTLCLGMVYVCHLRMRSTMTTLVVQMVWTSMCNLT